MMRKMMAQMLDDNYITEAINEKVRRDMRDKIIERVLDSVKNDLILIVEESLKEVETSTWAMKNFSDYTYRLVCEVKDKRENK
jgi:hypothetical protein